MVSNDKPALTIAPEHFEDLADAMAAALVNVGLVPGPRGFDEAAEVLARCLRFQSNLHETWTDGDEETAVRSLMDGRSNSFQNGNSSDSG